MIAPTLEIASLPGPDSTFPNNDKFQILGQAATYRISLGQDYFAHQSFACYKLRDRADLGATIWEGFKGGLHQFFVVRVAPVSTVILSLFGKLVLGELIVQGRMLSGFLVFEKSWPVAPNRDLRVGTVMLSIRAAMLQANMLRCSQDVRLVGRNGQLHPRSLLWSGKRPKAKYEKILVASKRRLVQKTDPRKLALSKLLPAF
ncbi:unnamed protein product [Symbiodinium sp. KB8]|nr:unnamed protein product [Symbiodinium sp. KB8]